MHCNCPIPLTGILGKNNIIATLPSYIPRQIAPHFLHVLDSKKMNSNEK